MSTLTFLLLFLLSDFLRGEGSLNVAAMGLGVDVLMAGRTFDVLATMRYIVFEPHFQFETGGTSTSTKTDGVLMAGRGFPVWSLARCASKQVSPKKSQ